MCSTERILPTEDVRLQGAEPIVILDDHDDDRRDEYDGAGGDGDLEEAIRQSLLESQSDDRESQRKDSSTKALGDDEMSGGDGCMIESFRQERGRMEKERLERLRKRQNSDLQQHDGQPRTKKQHISQPSVSGLCASFPRPDENSNPLRFGDGHVGLTYVPGFSRAGYLGFEELVQKVCIRKAIP
jgi:hypothetical protein